MIWIGAPGQYKIHVITSSASASELVEWEFFAIQKTAPRVSLSATPEAATPIATNVGGVVNLLGYVANTDGDGVKPREACQVDASRAFPDKVVEGSELQILRDIKSGTCTGWFEVNLATDESKRFFIHSVYVSLRKPSSLDQTTATPTVAKKVTNSRSTANKAKTKTNVVVSGSSSSSAATPTASATATAASVGSNPYSSLPVAGVGSGAPPFTPYGSNAGSGVLVTASANGLLCGSVNADVAGQWFMRIEDSCTTAGELVNFSSDGKLGLALYAAGTSIEVELN